MNTTAWVDFMIDAPPAAALAVKITLLLAAAWAAHFALGRANPRWRVLLWRAAALGVLALPGVALLGPALKVAVAPAPEELDLSNVVLPPVAAIPARNVTMLDAPPVVEALAPTPPPAEPWKINWPLTGAAAWGMGVLLLGVRQALGQRAMQRVIRRAAPAPEAVQKIFDAVALELGVTQARLAVSEAVRSPLLFGPRRPVVLLPAKMCGAEFAADLPAIFAHELNHAAARDLAWLGVVRLAQTLLWPHPLAWAMRAACAAATERVTDAAAAEALSDREKYARSLARVALALAGRPVGQTALAMAIPDIRRRLLTLKQGRAARPLRRGVVRLVMLGCVGLVAALGALRPVAAEQKIGGETTPAQGEQLKAETTSTASWEAAKRIEVERLHDEALKAYEARDLKKARELWQCILEVDPQNKPAQVYLEQTKAEWERISADQSVREHAEQLSEKAKKLLSSRVSITTENRMPLDKFMNALSYSAPAGMKFKIADGIKGVVYGNFQNKPLRDVLDAVLFPTGLSWSVNGQNEIVIEKKLITKTYTLSSTQMSKVSALKASSGLQKSIWGQAEPPAEGCAITLDERLNMMVVTGSKLHIQRVENLLPELEKAEHEKMEICVYKIKEADGLKIKALINSIYPWEPLFNPERKIYIDKDDLTIRDTPENIKKIEELLRDKNFIKTETRQKLDIANFSLVPHDTSAASEQVKAYGNRVVNAIKVFLYAEESEARANKKGRQLLYDSDTMQLTIVDTTATLARVSKFLGSIPELAGNGDVRQEVIKLEYKTPEAMIARLQEISAQIARSEREAAMTLQCGKPRDWKGLKVTLRRVSKARSGRPEDDAVEFEIQVKDKVIENRSMLRSATEFIDNYKVTVENVIPREGAPGEGTARLRITWLAPQGAKVEDELPALLEGISLTPIAEPKGIIVRYRERDTNRFKDIQDLVRQFDVKPKEPTAETAATTATTTPGPAIPIATPTPVPAPARPTLSRAPAKPDGRTRQEVVFLQYAVADDLAYDLVNRISPTGEKHELNLMVRVHHSLRLGDAIVNLRNLDAGKDDSTTDGSAELVVSGEDKAETFRLAPGQRRTVRDHEITVSAIGPIFEMKENALFLHVAFKTRPVPGKALPKPLEGITIDSFGERNGLIVRYTNPESYRTLMAMVKDLDKCARQISLETAFLDVKDPALDLAGELNAKLLDGQAGEDKQHLAPAKLTAVAPTRQTFDKITALERAGRLKRMAGPKVLCLEDQESVFRIEVVKNGKKADAMVVRTLPGLSADGKRIHLKKLQVEVSRDRDVEPGVSLNVPGAPLGAFMEGPPDAAGGKPDASRTYALEVNDGQAMLLPVPGIDGRYLMMPAYIVK